MAAPEIDQSRDDAEPTGELATDATALHRRDRPRSLGMAPLTEAERMQLSNDERWIESQGLGFPATFGDCEPGPCPWVSCSMHLYLEVSTARGLPYVTVNFPEKEPWELEETCALRKAGLGAMQLDDVGRALNISEEAATKQMLQAFAKVRTGEESPDKPLIKVRRSRPGMQD